MRAVASHKSVRPCWREGSRSTRRRVRNTSSAFYLARRARVPQIRLEKRNSFCSAQASIGGNQRKLENFCGSGKKGVSRISVRKLNLAHGENDLGCQGRLLWRKLGKRLRNPFLETHVQFDPSLFDEDPEFPDA